MNDSRREAVLLPAIDLRHGRCVRLEKGEADRETVYDTDPFQVAERFAAEWAEWLHIVDLDAAFGDGSNREIIRELAERTDPGWIVLFPAASGLLVEYGSLLSHSAIVSRELGLPAIVSLTGITRWLKDGDWVEFDGSAGVVTRLERPDA